MSRPEFNTPCIACGYELAGIPDDRNCPECGLATEVTRERKTRIPQSLHRTLRLSARSAILAIASVPTALLIAALAMLMYGKAGVAPRGTLQAFIALATLATAASCWRLTTPIPVLRGPLDARRCRAALRASLVAAALVLVGGAAITSRGGLTGTPADLFPVVYAVLLGIAFAVAHLSLIAYIHWLALAVPSRALRVRTKAAFWQGCIAIALAAAAGLTWLFTSRNNAPGVTNLGMLDVLVAVATPVIPIYLLSTACSMLVALINRLKSVQPAPSSP